MTLRLRAPQILDIGNYFAIGLLLHLSSGKCAEGGKSPFALSSPPPIALDAVMEPTASLPTQAVLG